jgi:hypothetical protein
VLVLLGLAVAASVYVDVHRQPDGASPEPVSATVEAPRRGDESRPAPPVQRGGADRVAVREMSQTFRHGTFLIAIRAAGFYCDDVVAAHESDDGVWAASCKDLQGYKISVEALDRLGVEPIPHYVDAAF